MDIWGDLSSPQPPSIRQMLGPVDLLLSMCLAALLGNWGRKSQGLSMALLPTSFWGR